MTNTTKTPSLAKASRILGAALLAKPAKPARSRKPKAEVAAPAEQPAAVPVAPAGASKGKVRTDNTERQRKADTEADLRKISAETGAPRLATIEHKKAKPIGHLAAGLDGRNSPHAAKAVQDNRREAAKDAKPAKVLPTPANKAKAADAKKAERKVEAAAKAAPKGDDNRAITILKKDFAFGRDGTARRDSWNKALKAKTAAAYIAAGGAAKYLPRWVSAGAIKLG